MKRLFFAVATMAALLIAQGAKAQTNLQTFYDFGSDRQHVTTTLEGFHSDNWGNTFFFIDYDYNLKNADSKVFAPSGTYMEIARCLNFWQESPLSAFSLHVEYNGGVGAFSYGAPTYTLGGYAVNSAFLAGVDWFLHSKDFKNTLNLKVLYKKFIDLAQDVPMQFTAVWGCQDIFGAKGLRFSGFADVWWEGSKCVFLSEPQLWYNVICDNFNIGGEVEISNNFVDGEGWRVRPCLGFKWVF